MSRYGEGLQTCRCQAAHCLEPEVLDYPQQEGVEDLNWRMPVHGYRTLNDVPVLSGHDGFPVQHAE